MKQKFQGKDMNKLVLIHCGGREGQWISALGNLKFNDVGLSNSMDLNKLQLMMLLTQHSRWAYCTISSNLASSVMCYQLAVILILAGSRFECDIKIFLAGRGKICARGLQIVHCKLKYIYCLHNVFKQCGEPVEFFFIFLIHFFDFLDGFSTLQSWTIKVN